MRTIKYHHNRENLEFYIQGLLNKDFTLKQVSIITGYTVQHLCNLKAKYKYKGACIFQNGHKGLASKNKISDKSKKKILDIYITECLGFNFNFFCKILDDYYDIHYSYRSIYKILTAAGIESPEKRRIKKEQPIHRPRYRRERGGELIQIDATPYQWFAWCGDKSYYPLHGAIDDAEEKLTGLCMTENECVYGYYDILEQTGLNFGLPMEIYSDRSAIFCVTPKNKHDLTIQEQLAGLHEKHTQWQRILSELRINQILAWSPQAKGRIERLWRTLQGRLPWYFKKYNIKTIEAANTFLKKEYISIFNSEFAVEREKKAIWRKPPTNFQDIICSKFERTTNSAGVISFQGYKFLIRAPHCAKRKIDLCIYKDKIMVLLDGLYYPVTLLDDFDGTEERMSVSLQNIIYQYLYSMAKHIGA